MEEMPGGMDEQFQGISTGSGAGRTGNEACAAVVAVCEVENMDQIQREKIAAKLKKIKALAERGVGGEKRKTGLSAEPVGGIYHCKAHVSADGSAAEIQGGVDGLFGG